MAKPTWVRPPDCSRGEIDRAGRALASVWAHERDRAAEVVNAWRASHNFPLNTFQTNLRYRAKRVDATAIVAQRLKRLSSIQGKLRRYPDMKLSRVQDIAGCRAIVFGPPQVEQLTAQYVEAGCEIRDDYIANPKPDGYRGIHVIGRYQTDSLEHEAWNGHSIEIQLRTIPQHAFATTVETVTTFTGQPLKFGGGEPSWRRFFALMSGWFSNWEATPPVPGVPIDKADLEHELRELAASLRVEELLTGWNLALRRLPSHRVSGAREWLLMLDPEKRELRAEAFRSPKAASVRALALEREALAGESRLDVVQVSAESIDELRRAYPNYEVDTSIFVTALQRAIAAVG